MVDHAAFVDAFADYARTIGRRYDITEVLHRLGQHVVAVLGISGSGVSIADDQAELQFVSATDEGMASAERAQFDSGIGPCQDAYATGERVISTDLRREPRWTNYRQSALQSGVRAVAAIPMRSAGQVIGALDLYRDDAHEWSADELTTAQILADMASGYILNALILNESQDTAAKLQHALERSVEIEQAKGMLAERHDITPAAAFERIRAHARNHRLGVHDVASAIVAERISTNLD